MAKKRQKLQNVHISKIKLLIKVETNHSGVVMVIMLASSVVNREFKPRYAAIRSNAVTFWLDNFYFEWVSEWLLLNAMWAMFQLYHGENKLHFDEMMMMYALY
jgi:hypothetical protein